MSASRIGKYLGQTKSK
ncbi:hypothetical protein OIU76_013330 [Salix suchowensis]|uniref:Uncharacterized protein n=1 Tax=Salix suchowensis TaxID=1278906 RepID=A0ABQ9A5M4_9ROSI|nr:hypothetical protein OIU76_013330 [Salix suchowensis]KAJ6322661.1 hypothetical protein OIU77_012492 [Salix suchowensis]